MSDRAEATNIAFALRDCLDGNPEAHGQIEFVDASDLRDTANKIERLQAKPSEAEAEACGYLDQQEPGSRWVVAMPNSSQQSTALRHIWLQRQPDGSFVDWGRHGPGRVGPALWYRGEAAKILALVLRHTEANHDKL
ncbi:hypothetical protein [Falsiroseomonas sp. CW058]|uniref:hypothetical protein n=1 Tax=Falsiroseomonas sp. CW058 TaxID=3388664 RepID=UPI003D320924